MVLSVKATRRVSPSKKVAIEEATREDLVRINAMVPQSLRDRLKMQAIHEGSGSTVTAILIQASEEYLSRYSK